MGGFLRRLCAVHGIRLEMTELDIQRDRKCDFTLPAVQMAWLQRITSGEFFALILTPPCSTFSRAVWANDMGPFPLRSRTHPRGFPWNAAARRSKADFGTLLADFSFEAFSRHEKVGIGCTYMEQPEDLVAGDTPASMWQFPQFEALCGRPRVTTAAFSQMDFGTPTPKPTRFLMARELPLRPAMRAGQPSFGPDWSYQGPLERRHGQQLIGRSQGQFKTAASAAWPGPLCQWVAQDILTTYQRYRGKGGGSGEKGLKRMAEAGRAEAGLAETERKKQRVNWEVLENEGSDPFEPRHRGGEGRARSCTWKGVESPFHDGGGRRWPRDRRRYPDSEQWVHFRRDLMKLMVEKAGGFGKLEQEAFRMAKGGEYFTMVKDPGVLKGVKLLMAEHLGVTEEEMEAAPGQPFRLSLMAKVLECAGDPDYEFLKEAEKGLPLGVLNPLPRTPAVFERQVKWSLEEWTPGGWVLERKNYPSAEEHKDHLRKHLDAEVEEGLMVKMTEEEFTTTYGNNRAVASLAVLVEDVASGKKRVIHDGTHGIGVNNRIRCLDKVRMPGAREKRKLLEDFKEERQVVLSIIGDFEKAHRRFKYKEEEWGFLA